MDTGDQFAIDKPFQVAAGSVFIGRFPFDAVHMLLIKMTFVQQHVDRNGIRLYLYVPRSA